MQATVSAEEERCIRYYCRRSPASTSRAFCRGGKAQRARWPRRARWPTNPGRLQARPLRPGDRRPSQPGDRVQSERTAMTATVDYGLARRMWHQLEPIHAVFWYAPQAFEEAAGLGYDTQTRWPSYFAWRLAPLGAIGPRLAASACYSFSPQMVATARARRVGDGPARAGPRRAGVRGRADVPGAAGRPDRLTRPRRGGGPGP